VPATPFQLIRSDRHGGPAAPQQQSFPCSPRTIRGRPTPATSAYRARPAMCHDHPIPERREEPAVPGRGHERFARLGWNCTRTTRLIKWSLYLRGRVGQLRCGSGLPVPGHQPLAKAPRTPQPTRPDALGSDEDDRRSSATTRVMHPFPRGALRRHYSRREPRVVPATVPTSSCLSTGCSNSPSHHQSAQGAGGSPACKVSNGS